MCNKKDLTNLKNNSFKKHRFICQRVSKESVNCNIWMICNILIGGIRGSDIYFKTLFYNNFLYNIFLRLF